MKERVAIPIPLSRSARVALALGLAVACGLDTDRDGDGYYAAADLEASLKRREKQAMDRIAQAEQSAVDEVRALAVDVAISATRQLLAEQAGSEKGDRLIDDAIKNLGDKLH